MPFQLFSSFDDLFTLRSCRRWAHSKTFEGPAYDSSQQPMECAHQQQDALLNRREMVADDNGQRDRTADYSHIEPPDNPAVDPNVDVHEHFNPSLFYDPAVLAFPPG